MRKGKKFLNILLYIFLTLVLFYQVMGLISVTAGPAILGASAPAKLQAAKGLIPSWILMTIAVGLSVVLTKVWRDQEKKLLIPMILGLTGAVLALLVALTLRAALPLQIADTTVSQTGVQGLSGWKLFWRHLTPIGIGIGSAIVSFCHWRKLRSERILKEDESYQENFALESGIPSTEAGNATAPQNTKKLSKKQRKLLQEAENSGK